MCFLGKSIRHSTDVRGYRPVNTYALINVYPKSGGERKASFIGDFKEDEDKSGNIRYFFPDGCRGIESAFPEDSKNTELTPKLPVSRPAFVTLPTQRIPPVTPFSTTPRTPAVTPEVPRTRELLPPLEPITERITISTLSTKKTSPPTEQQTPYTQKQTQPTLKPTLPTQKQTPEPQPTTPRSMKLQPPFPDTTNIVNKKVPNTDTCSNKNSCCEDESMAKLIIPIPMKNVQQSTGSSTCGTFAKLIIPLPLAGSQTLSGLTSNLNELNTADLIKIDPDKIDYKFTGKNDEHRFGVEVKENKQFHHTRTEEDGVRLGCYGYVHPNGKAYSTHYVADNKGYRIVPHQGEILVYPKDGSVARMASFFESFNEDEIKSSNIRYFFPNGCKSTMIDIRLIDPSATPKPYVSPQFDTKTNADLKLVPGVATSSISGSKTITGKNLDNRYLPTGEVEIEEPEKNEFLKIDQVTPLPTVSVTSATTNAAVVPLKPIFPGIPSNPIVPISPSKTIVPVSSTKEVIPAPFKPSEPIVPAIPSKPSVPLIPSKPSVPLIPSKPSVPLIPSKPSVPLIPSIPSSIPIDPVAPFSPSKPIIPKNPNQKVNPSNPIAATDNNNQCQDCCEDTLRPTLLMARNSEATCCKKDVAKLSIPISMDKLAKIAMSELIEITSETNTITMLKKLLALAEKYQF
ncbi:unnamed protein product [Diamesa serratosioi]